MPNEAIIDVPRATPAMSRSSWRAISLCFCVAMLDGFDTQSIGFVAPLIAREWGIDPALLGSVFAAGLVGVMLGAMILGPLGDRFGRRPMIIASTALFGVGSALTALAGSPTELLALRLLTGLGLGSAMPNLIALTDENAGRQTRAVCVALMFTGIPLGAAIGAFGSGALIGASGWRAVFAIGGALPLILLVPLVVWLPESDRLGAGREGAARQDRTPTGAVRSLFTDGRAPATIAVWLTVFANLLVMYLLVTWLPTLLTRAGLSIRDAVTASVVLNAGGVTGGVVIGWLMQRLGANLVVAIFYVAMALCVGVAGAFRLEGSWFLAAVYGAGIGGIGGQLGMNALLAGLYPTDLRSTAVGWALAIGRVGSITGPLAAGLLVGAGWRSDSVLLLFAGAGLLAALGVISIARKAP